MQLRPLVDCTRMPTVADRQRITATAHAYKCLSANIQTATSNGTTVHFDQWTDLEHINIDTQSFDTFAVKLVASISRCITL